MATIGNTNFSGGFTSVPVGYKFVGQWTSPASGVISNPRMYLQGQASAATVRFIIYAGASGSQPGAWIASSNDMVISASQAAGWVTFTFASPPTFVNGTIYAMGIHVSSGVDIGNKATGGFGLYYVGTDTFSDGTYTGNWESSNHISDVEMSVAADIGTAAPTSGFLPFV